MRIFLFQIKSAAGSKPDDVKVNHDEVHRVLGDVKNIRGRQDSLTSKLDVLQRYTSFNKHFSFNEFQFHCIPCLYTC